MERKNRIWSRKREPLPALIKKKNDAIARQFQKFLRSISGLIARFVLNAKKGRPAFVGEGASVSRARKKNQRKFWSSLAFTRVTEWGQAFTNLSDYVIQNIMEAAGVIPHQPRKPAKKGSSKKVKSS